MIWLLLALLLIPDTGQPQPPRHTPPSPADKADLDTQWATWPLKCSLDDWWDQAYGGVDTPQERS